MLTSCSKNQIKNDPGPGAGNTAINKLTTFSSSTPIPATTNNKVAYYTFDATPTGSPAVKLSMLDFAKSANIVVVFEGTPWELADTAHYTYPGTIMLSGYYKNYRSIINDIHTLQARGVKVIINVDDQTSWNTTTPFTTYNGIKKSYQQFAVFLDSCVTNVLNMDGIGLDVEHLGSTAANANYVNLIKEFGKYFGPKSTKPTTTVYTAAIYDGGQAGFAIGQSVDVASYMNFVIDQGYFEDNTQRFYRWANYIGAEKTMVGLVKDYNNQANGIAAAKFQPTNGNKAGIMVYAANVDSAYSNNILRALSAPVTAATGAVFYQDTQYGLTATKAIPKGSYTLTQLKTYGFIGNWASSVKLPTGWTMTMYKGTNLSGTSWALTTSNADFTKLLPSANDVVNSVKIN
ncbi:hypothetical protein GCM10007352_29790 [Mucilaginibacter phyllosphaerae]|nr:hypothetical protein GCM10007352_29790 [Mucilaginibacter phyllosphaerae]